MIDLTKDLEEKTSEAWEGIDGTRKWDVSYFNENKDSLTLRAKTFLSEPL